MKERKKVVSGLFRDLEITVKDKNGNIKQVVKETKDITPKLFKKITIKDKYGNIKFEEEKESHSYVKQFLQLFEREWRDTGVSTLDITNTSRSLTIQGYRVDICYTNAQDDDDTFGIVIGTSSSAEDNTNYKLGTKITHGLSSGKLDYGEMGFVNARVVGSNIDLVITRSFYNGSGSSITCYEFGIYAKAGYQLTSYYTFCIIRDVEAGGKVVADGDTLTIQYTIRLGAGFCIAYGEALQSFLEGSGVSITDISGTEHAIWSGQNTLAEHGKFWKIDSADNDDDYGLVVGTGTNAESQEDTKLQTLIVHGVGSGQLDYQAHSWATSTIVGANVDLILSRNFYNGSGGTITINEVGIYGRACYYYWSSVWYYFYFCTLRDKLDTPVTVNDTDSTTIQYTFRTNVSI